jgi:predicted transcriptional regulator
MVPAMARTAARVNIVLDDERAAKLRRLADRTHTNPGSLARSLLSTAIDDVDPDPSNITSLLDRIDGAWDDAMRGSAEAQSGEGIPLEDL